MQGTSLQALRESQQLTQGELAKRIKISRCYYNQLETGTRTPSLAVASRLAQALNCPMEDIFLLVSATSGNITKTHEATGA